MLMDVAQLMAQNSTESKGTVSIADELSAIYKNSIEAREKNRPVDKAISVGASISSNVIKKEAAPGKPEKVEQSKATEVPKVVQKPKVVEATNIVEQPKGSMAQKTVEQTYTAGAPRSNSKPRARLYDSVSVDEVLDISVYQEPDLSKIVKVAADGTINLPLIGVVHVDGLSPKEIEEDITESLGRDYLVNPQVTVLVKEHTKVYVQGEVGRPGAYELKDGLTVIGAIALAGGMTDLASPNGVKIIRTKNNKTSVVNVPVGSMLKGSGQQQDVELESNDTIVVPESAF